MRCPRCERETKDGTVFCPNCGAPLSLRPERSSRALDTTLDLDRRAAGQVDPPPHEPRAVPAAPARPAGAPPPRAPAGRAPPAAAAPPVAPRPRAVPAPPPRAVPVPAPAPPPAVPPSRAVPAPPRTAPPPRAAAPPAAPRPEPRPPPSAPPRAPEPPALPEQEASHWDMRLSQMPRERRPELGSEHAAEHPPPPKIELWSERAPSQSGTLDIALGPAEIHLRRAPDWKRALAWLIDGLPFAALFAFALRLALDRLPHAAPLDLAATLELAGTEAAGITGPIFAGTLVIFAVYHVLAHGMSGATLGKRLLGIRVVGRDGQRPGLGRATARALLGAISLLLLGLGVLLALFTRSGRALHDFLARTWVVEAP